MASKNGSKPNTKYNIEVDIDGMTWGDATLQARFMLIQSEVTRAQGGDDESQLHAMRAMVEVFDEMTDMLDRVAIVKRDGERIPARKIPQSLLGQVMAALSDAQARAADPND